MTLTAGTLALHIDESACYFVQSPLSYQDLKERKKSIHFKTKIKCVLDILKPFWLHQLLPAAFVCFLKRTMTVKPNKIFFDEIVWYIFLKKGVKHHFRLSVVKKKYKTKSQLNDQSKNKVHNTTNWWEFKFDKIIAWEHAQAGRREVGNLSPSWARAFPRQQESERNARPGEITRPP